MNVRRGVVVDRILEGARKSQVNDLKKDDDKHSLSTQSGYLDFLPVVFTNTLLVIATLNLFIFWAKSNVRGYLWRTTSLQGQPLCYSGEGHELALGFVFTAALSLLLFGYPGLITISALNIDPEVLTIPDVG